MYHKVSTLALSCIFVYAFRIVAAQNSEEPCDGGRCHQCTVPATTGVCFAHKQRFFYNVQTCRCEGFVYGGCGGNENNYDTLEQCQSQCGHIQCPVCNLPSEKGPCEGLLKRWYFDAADCTCKPFQYGGCSGNHNNFPSKADCEGACGNSPCPVCSQPAEPGSCFAAFERWYYDALTDQCQNFIWGGCQRNGNNFKTTQQCESVCKGFVCTLPKDVGPCEATVRRFYYDQKSGRCRQFTWGGCEPNGNNFESKRECKRTCKGR